ncbi:hypothetical protein LINPERPRIM_LOCUS31321 [Linum perenne]
MKLETVPSFRISFFTRIQSLDRSLYELGSSGSYRAYFYGRIA